MEILTPASLVLREAHGAEAGVPPDQRVAGIYEAQYQRLLGLASLLTGTLGQGEELAQECFVIALRKERETPGYLVDPVWPWLRITAVRLASRLRIRLRHELLSRAIPSSAAAFPPAWSPETVDVIRALGRLPPRMRACVVLAHLEDQSTGSIADQLGCSAKTVQNQLREGRHRLRAILGDSYTTS